MTTNKPAQPPQAKGVRPGRRLPRAAAPRRESTSSTRFVKLELYLDAKSARRILESPARYSITLRDTAGKVIEKPTVMRARLVEDPVVFAVPPRGFGGRRS